MRFKIVIFLLWRRDPVLELQNRSDLWAVVHSSLVFGNSASADRSGMAASRLLLAAAARVILLRFAAESHKSHCNGSVRRVNGALAQQIWWFGIDDFPFKFLLKRASKSSFVCFGVEIRFWSCKIAAICKPLCIVLLCLVTYCLRQGCFLRQLHA